MQASISRLIYGSWVNASGPRFIHCNLSIRALQEGLQGSDSPGLNGTHVLIGASIKLKLRSNELFLIRC